jgi:1-acyl-sn-glycerol-3-phosphate acyltransferase
MSKKPLNYRDFEDLVQHWQTRLHKLTAYKLSVKGLDHIQPGQNYVVMVNHSSLMDIPVTFAALAPKLKFIRMVSKIELRRVPFFGYAMELAGFVFIDRNDRRKAMQSLALAKTRFEEGLSVWLAPEGTRSRTGELLPFKKGSFVFAIDMQAPVLPVVLKNVPEILPKKSFGIRRGAFVEVVVGEPISTKGMTYRDREKLQNAVRDVYVNSGLSVSMQKRIFGSN